MPLALFILVNTILFVRPAELVPALEGAPLYEAAILACLCSAAPRVVGQLNPGSAARHPLTACILGLFGSVVMSQLAAGSAGGAVTWGVLYAKIVVYYLLLVAVVDTTARLRLFLGWVAVLILALTSLTLLQHHEVIDLPALAAIQQADLDRETGEQITYPRLCGMGIFNDPNDLSVILVVGMMVCLSRLGEAGLGRLLWLPPLGLMGYALVLTKSRGGFLALVGASAVLLVSRFGFRRAVLLGAPGLVALVVLFGGRQTNFDFDNEDDTSQHRIRLWRDGMVLFRSSPVFGIGTGHYEDECGLVAHNSFVHAYTELGLLGGTLFLAAFVYPLGTLHALGAARARTLDPRLLDLRVCLMACVAGMGCGMLSLSRNYTLPPYLVLGLVTVYFRLVALSRRGLVPVVGERVVGRVVLLGVAFLVLAEGFIRVFAKHG